MEQSYRIQAAEADVESHIRLVASSFECGLDEIVAGEGLPAGGEGRRIYVVKKYGSRPIARVGLLPLPDGTDLLVSNEPDSDWKGRDFDTEAFEGFLLSLIAQLPEHWQAVRLT